MCGERTGAGSVRGINFRVYKGRKSGATETVLQFLYKNDDYKEALERLKRGDSPTVISKRLKISMTIVLIIKKLGLNNQTSPK